MRSLRRVAVPILLVVCSLLIFLLLPEIVLRAIDHPRREGRILGLAPIMGNVYCPNIEERLDNNSQFRGFLDLHGIAHADAFGALSGLSSQQRKNPFIGDHRHLSTQGHRFFAEESLPALKQFILAPRAVNKPQP